MGEITNEKREYDKKYRQQYKERLALQKGVYYLAHRQERIAYTVALNNRIKNEVLTYYGGGKLACAKCGFTNIWALTIDHIDGKGADHRKQIGHITGKKFYLWLKANNYPTGYQTLCWNCQWIKRHENKECQNVFGKRRIN